MREINMPDGGSPDIPKLNESDVALRKESLSREDLKLITSMIDHEADLIARYSVGPTIQVDIETGHIVNWGSGEKQDEKIAKVLAQVPLDDKKLEELYIPDTNSSEITNDQFAHMAAIAAGKAKAVEEKPTIPPEEKKAFNKWRKKTGNVAGKVISRIGGKKGVALAGSTVLLVTTACNMTGSVEPSKPSPTSTPEGIGGSVTMVDPSATKEASKTATATETKTQTSTPEVDYSLVDVFDMSTWPAKFVQFAENGWMHSEDAARNEFQQFVEKARAEFFKKENIDISEYKNVNENERSLWGMVEWYSTHPDEVKEKNLRIVVTPTEYEASVRNFYLGYTFIEVAGKNEKIIYAADAPVIEDSFYTTDLIGRPIAGKDNLELLRGGFNEATGAFFGLGVVGAGENQGKVGIMDIIDMHNNKHNLFIFAIPEVDLVLPKGYINYHLNVGGPFILDQDYPVGKTWEKWGEDDDWFLTKAIGVNIKIAFVYGSPPDGYFAAPHPILGGEMVADIRGGGEYVPYSPWGEQLEPLATETPVATST